MCVLFLQMLSFCRRGTLGAQDAVDHICRRHNYQIKRPVTVDKVLHTLKQEAHEALAGAAHQSYTMEQIFTLGRVKYGVDLRKGTDLDNHAVHHEGTSTQSNNNVHRIAPEVEMTEMPHRRKTLGTGDIMAPDQLAVTDFV